MSGNVHVQRAKERLDLELDMADAVKFAEGVIEDSPSVNLSVPAKRMANLALCFLEKMYPFMCCGHKGKDASVGDSCKDCPMRGFDM